MKNILSERIIRKMFTPQNCGCEFKLDENGKETFYPKNYPKKDLFEFRLEVTEVNGSTYERTAFVTREEFEKFKLGDYLFRA